MSKPSHQVFKRIVLQNNLLAETEIDALLAEFDDPEQAVKELIHRHVLNEEAGEQFLGLYKWQLETLFAEQWEGIDVAPPPVHPAEPAAEEHAEAKPKCKGQVSVPTRPARSSPSRESPPPSSPPPQSLPAASSGSSITRRSVWSIFLRIVGALSLWGGLLGSVIASDADVPTGTAAIILVCGIAGGLQAFFFAFLVDVFTDIRWLLKQLVDKP